MAQYIDIYDYDFLLGASAMAQQEALYAVANAGSLSAVGTVNQIVGFDAAGNPVAKDVGGDSNGAGLAFSGDTLTATLPQNLKTTGAPTFAGVTLSGLTADRLLFSNASKAVTSSALTYDSASITVGGLNSLDFAAPLTPNPMQPGRLQWNDQDGTLDLGVKGGNVTLQIGQEQLARVVNKTGSNLLEAQYKVVRINEAQGQRIGVALAQANSEGNSTDIIGIVTEDIPVNQEGFVTVHGVVRDIDTTGALQGETWADGDVLYLSPTIPGGLTKSKPKAPNHLIMMAYVAYAHSQHGKIFVAIQSSWETHELHDVQFGETAPAAGSLLIRDATVGVWKPALLQAGANIALSFSDGAISIASTAAGVTPGNKGDITVDAVTGAWTINAGAVLNADLASMANGTIKARITTGAGAPEDATITQVLDLAAGGTAAQGDILYRTGSTWTRLPAGTVGQYLQTAGTANPPSWADVTGVTPGNKGDISVDAITGAWTINAAAVLNADLANMASGTIKARIAGTTGAPEDATLTQILDLAAGATAAQGDILYRTGSTWTRLPAGTVGQYLQTAGTANPPAWADVTGVTPGNKGDISVDAITGAWTINAAAVLNADLASMTNGTVKARVAGTTGAPQDVTISDLFDSISSTRGSLLYRGASGWTTIPPGTSGQYLKTLGSGTDPLWADVSGGGGGGGVDVLGVQVFT